jgi:hypothetical protein
VIRGGGDDVGRAPRVGEAGCDSKVPFAISVSEASMTRPERYTTRRGYGVGSVPVRRDSSLGVCFVCSAVPP